MDYGRFSDDEKERYNSFGDAWMNKLQNEGPPPLTGPIAYAMADEPIIGVGGQEALL